LHAIPYNEPIYINGVKFSFHPAGHIIGSAQIRVAYKGEVWVASGDYKTFELVKCHAFITESTFGLPIFKWEPQAVIAKAINDWWKENKKLGKTSILGAYALGKAQRLIHMLDPNIGKIFTHGAVENINEVLRGQGIPLKETTRVTQKLKRKETRGGMIICPPGSLGTSWTRKFEQIEKGVASGWMMQDGSKRKLSFDKGFILSDHADWEGLNQVIKATTAEKVIVTHGYADSFAKWLRGQGLEAQAAKTAYEGEQI